MARPYNLAALLAGALLGTLALMPAPARAQEAGQRLSLADRVNRLEQQQAEGGIGLVNQVQQLRNQVQTLQGQVEELQHELQLFRDASKDRYVDLDSRMARLEGRAPGAAPGTAPVAEIGGELPSVELGPAAGTPVAPAEGAVAGAVNVPAGDPQADYQQAFSALRNGDFASSARLFQAFITRYPNEKLTPNAYYWLGESYYGSQNYRAALGTFQDLLRRFPDDAKAGGALLKVGYCQFELEQWDQARSTLEQVRSQYPNSREAHLAEGRLRALGLQTRQ